jgi:integrase
VTIRCSMTRCKCGHADWRSWARRPEALRKLHSTQQKERLAAGEAYHLGSHGGYVAADELGEGYTTPRLRNIFYRLVEATGVRKITSHHARHSTLSYLLNSGQVPIAIVAAWAGHADGGATALKHYIRTRPGDLEAARDAIAELLGA